jgi:plastocyanin
LGAKVEVLTGEQTITRWVGTWSSFQSQGSDTLIFGLGAQDLAELVRVTFTDGSVVEHELVSAGQILQVVEGRDWWDEDHDGVPDEWDLCPGTVLGRQTDGDGCALGQRGGLAVAGTLPESYSVVTDCFSFEWEGDVEASAVVQVSGDGTFGLGKRLDLGPVSGGSVQVCGDQLDELRALSDGNRPMIWRVALAGDDGREALSLPKSFYLALPVSDVQMPRGASVFSPAHIVVEQGTTVSWWNNSVNAGNLQNELHDVQLLDASGAPISEFRQLVGGAYATWTFNQPGIYHAVCHMHSGMASEGDHIQESTHFQHHQTDGPHRCMAGTVTVR